MSEGLRIVPKEHFWVSGLKRAFDLSGIIPLYVYVSENLDTIKRGVDMEYSIGTATIVYSVDKYNTIHLITGWKGTR